MTWIVALVVVVLASPAWAACTGASPTWTTTPDQASVQTCVTGASAGDTINVSAGTAAWTTVTLSGVNLIGAGSSPAGTVITAGSFAITKHATRTTRVSGFRFTGSDTHGSFAGSKTARAFIIDSNYFNVVFGMHVLDCAANGGVLHHNMFHKEPDTFGAATWVIQCHSGETWTDPHTMGNADTQGPLGGERNIYFEDNTFENIPDNVADVDQGGRLVMRHNVFKDSSTAMHGGGGQLSYNDTSTTGHRHSEFYANTFIRTPYQGIPSCPGGDGVNLNHWIWFRGGAGVVANNVMDLSYTSPCYSPKPGLRLAIGCNHNGTNSDPYPVPFQIGQLAPAGDGDGLSLPTPENPPSHPTLIFGNGPGPNSNGPADAGFISLEQLGTGGGGFTTCSNPGNYIVAGRDYALSNVWGWVPFTYPHPLIGAAVTLPGTPTGLTVN